MGLDWCVKYENDDNEDSGLFQGETYYRGKNTERLLESYGYETDICFGDEEDVEHRFRITDEEIQYIIEILAECKEKLLPQDDDDSHWGGCDVEEQEEECDSATAFLTEILEHNKENEKDKVILFTWY